MPENRNRRAVGRPGSAVLLPRVGLLVLLVAAAALLWLPEAEPRGRVVDAQTGEPVRGARATSAAAAALADGSGAFRLPSARFWQPIVVEAEGYVSRTVWPSLWPWPPPELLARLEPLAGELRVLDADEGEPLEAHVTISRPSTRVERLGAGRYRVSPLSDGLSATVASEQYRSASGVLEPGAALELRLEPIRRGRVVDARTGRPLGEAELIVDGRVLAAASDGAFELAARPSGPVQVLAPGYRRLELPPAAAAMREVRLEPLVIHGLYLTYFGVGNDELRAHALRLARTTEVNAVVIDVKGDRGLLSYRSSVPLAERIGANAHPTIPDIEQLLAELRQAGVYTIARIVVFKDDLLARNGSAAGLDVAIRDEQTGAPWVDGEGLAWVDPFREEAWAYNIALAREAALKGFDEVQYDYIRFPTDPSSATSVAAARYSREPAADGRVRAIESFLQRSREALHPLGVTLGVDIFGYTCWREDDLGIGQHLETIAAQVDYVHPMIYPSTFRAGLPGSTPYPEVVARPYDVVLRSLERARERIGGRRAVLRPWLQYFDDYPWETGQPYNAPEIEAQTRATVQAGTPGWMMWDPSNRYARGGFLPRAPATGG